jgi:hypothetical protein
MTNKITSLTFVSEDRGFCKVFVKDQNGKIFVILDEGRSFEEGGWGPRFQLHTCAGVGSEACHPLSGYNDLVRECLTNHYNNKDNNA